MCRCKVYVEATVTTRDTLEDGRLLQNCLSVWNYISLEPGPENTPHMLATALALLLLEKAIIMLVWVAGYCLPRDQNCLRSAEDLLIGNRPMWYDANAESE